MWGDLGCVFKVQPSALASLTSQVGFDFSSLGPHWLHTSSCWGRFAGAGSEHGDCCALLYPCSPPQLHMEFPQLGMWGLVWGGALLGWGWHSCEWPGEEILLTWCRCSWQRRGWSRREGTSVWCGEWSWSVGLQSSCSGHSWSVADEQWGQVLFQCQIWNGLLNWFVWGFFFWSVLCLSFFFFPWS